MKLSIATLLLAVCASTAVAQVQSPQGPVFDPNQAIQSVPGITTNPVQQQQYQGSVQYPGGTMLYQGGMSGPIQGNPPWYQSLPAAGGTGNGPTAPATNFGSQTTNSSNWISPAPKYSPPPK